MLCYVVECVESAPSTRPINGNGLDLLYTVRQAAMDATDAALGTEYDKALLLEYTSPT